MRFIKCFIVLCLCLFMGNCPKGYDGKLDIDIGDYDNQLEAWNSRNLLDYQIRVAYSEPSGPQEALITVRGGIPESGSSGIPGLGSRSTVIELYSSIKVLEKNKRDGYESGYSSLKVSYNAEYHYPHEIISKSGSYDGQWTTRWLITVMPLEEGELDIDIGDYEAQLEAWNSRNMLDYEIKTWYCGGTYNTRTNWLGMEYYVINGIPYEGPYGTFIDMTGKKTIPELYAYIKREEERIRNAYNGINRSFLNVQYDAEYHYPTHINSGVGHLFGRYWSWEITITPREGE